jgi:hypothetical protein
VNEITASRCALVLRTHGALGSPQHPKSTFGPPIPQKPRRNGFERAVSLKWWL